MTQGYKPWNEQGCSVCRANWESGSTPPELAINIAAHARLHRCDMCGAYWSQEERFAAEIDEQQARETFPMAFSEGGAEFSCGSPPKPFNSQPRK